MTDTPSLGKAHLQPRAGSPEVPINEWMDVVENASNRTVSWDVATKSHLTQADLATGQFHRFFGDPSGTVEVTIDGTNSEGDALHRAFSVINDTLEAIRVSVFGQSGSATTIPAGLSMALRSDGASVEEFVVASAAVASIDAADVIWDPTTYDLGDDAQAVIERLYSDLLAISTGDTGGAAQGTFLVSGGQVAWQSAYTYRVSAASYFINGVSYTSSEQTITLNASDANFDRIDVIAVDTTGTVVKVTGTAASEPSEPDVDPGSQLKLSFALVNAASTQPTLVTNTPIYSENAGEPGEWNGTTSGVGFTLNSSTSPRTGSFCIDGTSVASGAYAEFSDNSGLFDPTTAERFVFFIQSKAAWNSNRGLAITMRSQSGAVVGAAVNIRRSGTYGFDSTQTAGYQQIAIPMEDFAVPAGTMVGRVRFTDFGGSIGFRIDDVYFQGGSGSTQPQSGLTQAQADALYAPIGASYVLVGPSSADPTLSNERRLLASPGATFTDGGPGGDVTLGVLRSVQIQVTDPTAAASAIATGDGQAFFRFNELYAGKVLTAVAATLVRANSTSGAVTVQIHNVGLGADVLSTALTIDANESDSSTAATPAVINAANRKVEAGQLYRIDVDGAGTGAKGLLVDMVFSDP